MKKYAGIDISKDDFHCAIPQDADYQQFKRAVYRNNEADIARFIAALPAEVHCVLEATGNYSLRLTYALVEAGIPVSVINPKSSAHFRKMLLQTIKTDDIDSQLLSLYGKRMQPPEFVPKARAIMRLKQQRTVLNQLQKNVQANKNLLHALSVHPFADEFSQQQIEYQLKFLAEQIKKVKEQMAQISQSDFTQQYEYATSVVGIGPRLGTAFIEATGGFTLFDTPKAFAKFIGISATYEKSGTSVNYTGQINRSGDPKFRALLYIASWSAIRYNKPCKDFYERLKANGKPSKLALVAVMNKLVRQVFAVVQQQRMFDNDWEERGQIPDLARNNA